MLLAMTKDAFPCHCERLKELQGNLKRYSVTFSTGSRAPLILPYHSFVETQGFFQLFVTAFPNTPDGLATGTIGKMPAP
jgi:hypothetical protein